MKSPTFVEGWRYLLTAALFAVLVLIKPGSRIMAQDAPDLCTDSAVWANNTTAAGPAISGHDSFSGESALSEVESITGSEEMRSYTSESLPFSRANIR